MIQATGFGTGVGKSFLVSLLSRIFSDDGYKITPFKTINITANTYNKEGKEFGYSQALQSVAARQKPDYRTNPCTIKPLCNGNFDIFLDGECVQGNFNPSKHILKEIFKTIIGLKKNYNSIRESAKRNLESLAKEYDIICI